MPKKTLTQKLLKTHQKIAKWTTRCQIALTRREAVKALRKVAKHTEKLAELQGRLYDYQNTDEFL